MNGRPCFKKVSLPSLRPRRPSCARNPVAPRRPEAVARNVAPPVAETGLGADFLADLAHELDQLGISEPSPKAAAPASRPQASNSGKNSTKPPAPAQSASSTEAGP